MIPPRFARRCPFAVLVVSYMGSIPLKPQHQSGRDANVFRICSTGAVYQEPVELRDTPRQFSAPSIEAAAEHRRETVAAADTGGRMCSSEQSMEIRPNHRKIRSQLWTKRIGVKTCPRAVRAA